MFIFYAKYICSVRDRELSEAVYRLSMTLELLSKCTNIRNDGKNKNKASFSIRIIY